MKHDIIIAGVGGQGILSIAAIIGTAALENNFHMKQAEVHGMSQRGGAVESHLRISDKAIHSDLIPRGSADMIISVEPMEGLRYLPFLKKEGWLITNQKPYINIPDYPDENLVYKEINKIPHSMILDADELARQAGHTKTSNMVMLGAASHFLDIPFIYLTEGITTIFKKKGTEIVDFNIKALKAGKDEANKQYLGYQ